ncbi:hypothetical protein, conserved [Babesia ovata]|uniref:C3H1-type domain-containing protein n=1 Tax=Babesia ovata TaxID=189622 RepID=A0A2H6KJP1_9APIC|nr:uncharacterized protein BOVATA_047000 [Babesia ovata]GBE63207.1 hypothetical protein, conserved [Babesia ovata]
MDTVSPLVALAPLPAAHHRRPPRRPEDPLPPEITFKPPHRRAVPPRRRTRQGTRQRQVRHGNGENGLENLAEALKKLIGDAIESATSSLSKRENELKCPDKRYDESLCKSLDDKIVEARTALNSDQSRTAQNLVKKSLTDLASDLEKHKSNKQKHYNEVHYLSEDAREKALKDVTERQASLNTLKESLNKFTDQNNCNQLLTNLTEGLEKFLGYNSDSKGYSGEGIVYSDLDRLCDGVMSFLHGVLESVKDDDNVTTYDVTPDKKISTLPEKLGKFMHKGSNVFQEAITQVSAALRAWSGELEERTKDVKAQFNFLKDHYITNFSSALNKLSPHSIGEPSDVAGRLGECIHHAQMLLAGFSDAKNACSKLDGGLQKRLQKSVGNVEVAVEKFVAGATNEELKAVVETACREINQLEMQLQAEVSMRITNYQVTLNNIFSRDIQNPITTVKADLLQVHTDLQAWIQAANGVLQEAQAKVLEIISAVRQDQGMPQIISTAAADFVRDALALRRVIDDAKTTLQKQVEEAQKAVYTMNEALRTDLATVKQAIKQGISKYVTEQVEEARHRVEDLEHVYKQELGRVKKAVDDAVGVDDKSGVLGSLSKLDTPVKEGLKAVRESIKIKLDSFVKTQILAPIQESVGRIKGPGTGGETGLEAIETAVREYIAKFDKLTFGATVEGWAMDIMKDKTVDNHLTYYFNGNKHKDEFKSLQAKKPADVKDAVKTEIGKILQTVTSTPQFSKGSIQTSLEGIKKFLDDLAGHVDAVKQTDFSIIGRSIEEKLGITKPTYSYDRNLQSAISTVLAAVSSTAKKSGEEIDNLIKQCKLTNINTALNEASALHMKLEQATPVGNSVPESYAKKADKEIEGILTAEIGKDVTDDTNPIKFTDSGLMKEYRKWTKSDGHQKGTLRQEISKITEVFGEATKRSGNKYTVVAGHINGYDKAEQGINNQLNALISENLTKELETQLPIEPFSSKQVTLDKLVTYNGGTDSARKKHTGAKKQLQTAINKIGEAVKKNLTSAIDVKTRLEISNSTLTGYFQQIYENLNGLCEAVDKLIGNEPKYRDGLQQKLVDLDSLIKLKGPNGASPDQNKHLQGILTRINTILGTDASDDTPNTLATIFTKAAQFKTEVIDKEANDAIKNIQSFIVSQIKTKTENIQEAAKNQYQSKIKSNFDDMKKKVTEDIKIIKCVIDDDLKSGVKGLIRKVMDRENMRDKSEHNKLSQLTKHQGVHPKDRVRALAGSLRDYLRDITHYIKEEVKIPLASTKPSVGVPLFKQDNEESGKVSDVQENLRKFFVHLEDNITRTYALDNKFVNLCESLGSSVSALSAPRYSGYHHPLLLDSLKTGLSQFCAELQTAYVNKYCDQEYVNADGPKYAKLFMSILRGVIVGLEKVEAKCKENGEWTEKKICEKEGKEKNPLGVFFENCGFKVPLNDGSKQGGELKWKHEWKGKNVFGLLKDNNTGLFKFVKDAYESDVLDRLHALLHNYYSACHLNHIPTPATPTSVYKMLIWLSGFWYNPMYEKVTMYVRQLFDKPKEESKLQDPSNYKLDATRPFSATTITETLSDVCDHAEKTLVAILGFGHAEGEYAVEFTDNSHKLFYPSNAGSCFDMLVNTLNRVSYQLSLLYYQCCDTTDVGGWRDCWYGRGIGGSAWNCNTMQCPNQVSDQSATQNANQSATQNANQSATQKHNQTCTQKCNQSVNCGLKSPLQSFLEDGLPGFLPHSFKSPGCKLECTLSNHRGIPCITPMGFTDLSVAASHIQRGADLKKVLHDFCGSHDSPLSKLCGQLNCLLGTAPKTLGDMYAFYYNFLNGWKVSDAHRKDAFDAAVKKAYFGQMYDQLDISTMFNSSVHSKENHDKGDLFSLSCRDTSSVKCGRYIQPLNHSTWFIFSSRNAGKYLTWVLYLTETFYNYLEQLWKECCDNCNKKGARCHDRSCVEKCQVKSAYVAQKSDTADADSKKLDNKNHSNECKSIVNCPLTRPTLCKYGFVFKSPWSLIGDKGTGKKRSCKDFCEALQRVLSKEKNTNDVLSKLIFETISEFLWKIRLPFSITLLALWSLSLLYLLHITVVRLDVLRIRSHLRSPSSHRIAAQSLLAAARVKALANVKYFSP